MSYLALRHTAKAVFTGDSKKKSQAIRLVAFLEMGFVLFITPHLILTAIVYSGVAEPQRQAQSRRPQKAAKRPAPKEPRVDYSRFSHRTHVTQQKLACDSCHKFPTKNWKDVRQGDAAFPDVTEFPEHASCLNCHREQFFARERPAPVICSNCHINVTPHNTVRYSFPSLGDTSKGSRPRADIVSDFGIYFPDDKHADVVGLYRPEDGPELKPRFLRASLFTRESFSTAQDSEPKNCAVCHQTHQPQSKADDEYLTKPPKDLGDGFWLKKGSFKTLPTTHAACFSCHSTESEGPPLPSDCGACHKLVAAEEKRSIDAEPALATTLQLTELSMLKAWRKRDSAATFRHEVHPDVTCVTCHDTAKMNTLEVNTLKVPVQSCGGGEGCHITPTTDDGGALNFEIDQKKANASFVCVKCHITFGREPVPANHLVVIPKATKK